jgi:hypothetical protein
VRLWSLDPVDSKRGHAAIRHERGFVDATPRALLSPGSSSAEPGARSLSPAPAPSRSGGGLLLTQALLLPAAAAGYPSCLPALQAAASKRQLPTLIVGAALNGDIIPAEANWRRFTAAARQGGAPVWEVVLQVGGGVQIIARRARHAAACGL